MPPLSHLRRFCPLLLTALALAAAPAAAHEDGEELDCLDHPPLGVPGVEGPADEIGRWSNPESWPEQGTHSMLLGTGKVLLWRNDVSYLWDPVTNVLSEGEPTNKNLCAGHSTLADGRVFVIGGGGGNFKAANRLAQIFDPASETWSDAPDMEFRRWYPTATTLADGRVLATSGLAGRSGATKARIPEVYDPATDTWTSLPGLALDIVTYAYMFLLPDGRLLNWAHAHDATRRFDVETETWEVLEARQNFVSEQGCAAMFAPGKVLKVGGKQESGAEVLDMNAPVPAWETVDEMEYPRRRCNLVLLPDGSALAVGGSAEFQDAPECAVHAPERWDPETEAWTTWASMARPRIYHSSAILLPDGRVLVAGGENIATPAGEENMEIFSPPYLFRGARPRVAYAPETVGYGKAFQVFTRNARRITSVALIRPGAATHNFDENQRYVPLRFHARWGSVWVRAPRLAGEAPPGDYMLFLVNEKGVPSLAHFLRLGGGPCANGLDDDGDGRVDRRDPQCRGFHAQSESPSPSTWQGPPWWRFLRLGRGRS